MRWLVWLNEMQVKCHHRALQVPIRLKHLVLNLALETTELLVRHTRHELAVHKSTIGYELEIEP
jgi:hypothetical protein